jgi:cation:H+ antiporter
MQIDPVIMFLGGVAVIVLGAEILLRSASRIAVMLGISPIIIGLTVVAVGTSVPELAVGIMAVRSGEGPLAIGNIAGTNILNILLILGLSAALRPLPIHLGSVRREVLVMIGAALALLLMSTDSRLTRAEGGILVMAAVYYTAVLLRSSRSDRPAAKHALQKEFGDGPRPVSHGRLAGNSALLLAGIALTVLGAELMVSGAVRIALEYGVSDAIIGLTIVALGTSAPELATTLVATVRNDRDVAIGNLIGSNIYNMLMILGITLLAAPDGIDVGRDILWIDLPLAALVAVICYPVFRSNRLVSRAEGISFIAAYLGYLSTLVLLRT